MLPARFAPTLFALFLSGQMSFLVSGVATFRALGPVDGFFAKWISAWLLSWIVAFFAALLCRKSAQWMVSRLVAS